MLTGIFFMAYVDLEKRAAKDRRHYEKTRERRIEYQRKLRDKYRIKIRAMMKACTRCGNTDIRVLEWHHRDPSQRDSVFLQDLALASGQ